LLNKERTLNCKEQKPSNNFIGTSVKGLNYAWCYISFVKHRMKNRHVIRGTYFLSTASKDQLSIFVLFFKPGNETMSQLIDETKRRNCRNSKLWGWFDCFQNCL